jgi:hypothetical protein
MLTTILETNQNGQKIICIVLKNTLQDVSSDTMTAELRYSTVSAQKFHIGRVNSKISKIGAAIGFVRTLRADFTACTILRDHVKACWKLCRKSIVPRYLSLDIISHVSIQSKKGPNNLDAVAFNMGTFL